MQVVALRSTLCVHVKDLRAGHVARIAGHHIISQAAFVSNSEVWFVFVWSRNHCFRMLSTSYTDRTVSACNRIDLFCQHGVRYTYNQSKVTHA